MTIDTNCDPEAAPAATAPCGLPDAQEVSALACWYASHPQIRRLWALDEVDSIHIVVKIEPTIDGYDALPAWLANSTRWADELVSALPRSVHLEMFGAPAATAALSAMNDRLIAEISWREEYCE